MERLVPAAERGATRIAERVVAKLAAQAAREALRSTADVSPAVRAPRLPRGGAAGPHATAVVRRSPGADGQGGLADIRVVIELAYPSDIGAQCGAVRRNVALRVGELAGMEAPDVAVDVERLHSAHLDGELGRVR